MRSDWRKMPEISKLTPVLDLADADVIVESPQSHGQFVLKREFPGLGTVYFNRGYPCAVNCQITMEIHTERPVDIDGDNVRVFKVVIPPGLTLGQCVDGDWKMLPFGGATTAQMAEDLLVAELQKRLK